MARKAAKRSSARKKSATKRKSTAKRKSTTRKRTATKAKKKRTATKSKKRTATKAKKRTATKAKTKSRAKAKPAAKVAAQPVKKARSASKPKNTSTLSYTQSEFLENIRAFCGLEKKKEAKELWEDIQLFLQDSLKKGYRVPLVGLGKMYVRKTKPRMGRNPATGEPIRIGAKKRVRFTAAKALKDAVL